MSHLQELIRFQGDFFGNVWQQLQSLRILRWCLQLTLWTKLSLFALKSASWSRVNSFVWIVLNNWSRSMGMATGSMSMWMWHSSKNLPRLLSRHSVKMFKSNALNPILSLLSLSSKTQISVYLKPLSYLRTGSRNKARSIGMRLKNQHWKKYSFIFPDCSLTWKKYNMLNLGNCYAGNGEPMVAKSPFDYVMLGCF